MKLSNSTYIISVKLIDSNDGKEWKLFERPERHCHFMDEIKFQNYSIWLRLDWSDIRNGDPTLDADIWIETNGKKKRLKNERWHHTEKRIDEITGMKSYNFQFKNLMLPLITKMTMAKTFTIDAILVRFDPEAQRLLDELDEKNRNLVRQKAIEISQEKKQDYIVRLENVLKAKDELEL